MPPLEELRTAAAGRAAALEADFTARLCLPAPPRALRHTVVYLAGSTLGNFADAAAIALFRYKIGIMPVIGACAMAGLGYTLIA